MEPTNLSPHDAVCHVPPRHVALDKRDRLSPLGVVTSCGRTVDLAGSAGLNDRSSRPRHSPRRTPQAVVDRVVALRRQRWTRRRIAQAVTVSPATLSRLLRRAGLNRLRDLEPAPPASPLRTSRPRRAAAPRYQEARPLPVRRPPCCRRQDPTLSRQSQTNLLIVLATWRTFSACCVGLSIPT